MAGGIRYNKGKVRVDLLPWDALMRVAEHYTKGAIKYPARNWEKGMKWNENCGASLVRHLAKWSQGEDFEVEVLPDGTEIVNYHDEAMAWNALALIAYRLREVGEDDRNKTVDTEKAPVEAPSLYKVTYDYTPKRIKYEQFGRWSY